MSKNARRLTALEEKFVSEAEAGFFRVGYSDDGAPYALGAKQTGNLFSMEVIEKDDVSTGDSVYSVDPDYDLETPTVDYHR